MTSQDALYEAFKEGFLSHLRDISFAQGFYQACETSVFTVAAVLKQACSWGYRKVVQPLKVLAGQLGGTVAILHRQARWALRALSLAPPLNFVRV